MFHILVAFPFLSNLKCSLLSSFQWKVISKGNSFPDAKLFKCVYSLYKQKSLCGSV